jgi:SNW domain-containing protein 1
LPPEQQKISREKNPLFVPRSLADFDDGGAFPEIHVAQYPRHMGNPHLAKSKGSQTQYSNSHDPASSSSSARQNALVSISVDENGRPDYTAIVTSGTNADKLVYSKRSDMRGILTPAAEDIALPSKEEEDATAAKTAMALQSRIATELTLAKPSGSAMMNASMSQNLESKTQFIHYTPSPDAPGYNPIAAKRVIQMVPAQVDPMMPPKHRHVKAPRGPAEDPVPVLHAPPEKLTEEERKNWDIPACISNWKNSKGYTIPLDKRLAADGRGLRDDGTINSNFATLSESLYLAERQAREEVRMRSMVQKKQMEMDRERREAELRELASRARMERGGMGTRLEKMDEASTENQPLGDFIPYDDEDESIEDDKYERSVDDRPSGQDHDINRIQAVTVVDDEEAQQRERLRIARRRERDREYRMQGHQGTHGSDDNITIKKARLEEDRDVSEKIALGVLTGTGSSAGGVDGRLYNQSSGFVRFYLLSSSRFSFF